MSRQIKPVQNNFEKQRTYTENKGKYYRAMKYGFYFEALLIDYAMMEDRLRSFIYHIGGFKTRADYRIGKGYVRKQLAEIVEMYRDEKESTSLGISSISSKMKIVRATLHWASEVESTPDEKYLRTLKRQYEAQLDIGGLLDTLDEINKWCDYRNEVIHALMNKNTASIHDELEAQAAKGMELAMYLDTQVKALKKGNVIRKSLGYKTET